MVGERDSEADAARDVSGARLPFVWDYDIDEATFRLLLSGAMRRGRPDRRWAAVRLLDYAT